MAFERAKKVGKRIVAYPEDQPSVLSSKDWINGLVQDPKAFVSQSLSTVPSFPSNQSQQAVHYVVRLFPIFGWISRYSECASLVHCLSAHQSI
jgi:solute carrier family 26 (sodium-independent sulfate anion transporter), member 11